MKHLPSQSPLSILRAEPSQEFSAAEERARRQRIVGTIDALRAQLASHPAPDEHSPSKGLLATRSRGTSRAAWLLRRHWRWGATVLPLAAAFMVWLLVREADRGPLVWVERGHVTIETGNGPRHLRGTEGWDQGNEIVVATDAEQASLLLPSRATVRLEPQSVARIERSKADQAPRLPDGMRASGDGFAGHAEAVHLQRGSVLVDVAQASDGETVRVYTEQARVVVRGTLFAVLVETRRGRDRTRVSVRAGEARIWSEGKEHVLKAGQDWSSDNDASSALPVSAGSGNMTLTPPNDTNSATRSPADGGAESRSRNDRRSNELGKQNELFAAAQAARRSGQPDLALRRFEALMRLHPRSEQAHNARVEHFRLLASLGRRAEAARSARAYVQTYPRGFAAAEAERLLRRD